MVFGPNMVNGVVDENVLDNYIVMPVDDCSLDPFISLDVVGGKSATNLGVSLPF